MSKLNMARLWLSSWGNNLSQSQEVLSASAGSTLDGNMDNESTTESTTKPRYSINEEGVSSNALSGSSETTLKPPFSTKSADSQPFQIAPKRKSMSPPQTQQNYLRNKMSTASLGSYAPGNWLGWTAKNMRSNSIPDESVNAENCGAHNQLDGEVNDANAENAPDVVEEAVDEAESQINSVPEHVNDPSKPVSALLAGSTSGSKKVENSSADGTETDKDAALRKKLWGFWNAQEDSVTRKEPATHARITNTILKSTPSVPAKRDISGEIASEPTQANTQEGLLKPDDAVLYKPHHSVQEFSKINTHKNENLLENMLVPNWQMCLSVQDSVTHASTTSLHLHSSPGVGTRQSFDIKYWKNYLSNISACLGLTFSNHHTGRSLSSTISGVPGTGSKNGSQKSPNMEEEFHLLHERSYKLYGKSLSRLPAHKRACLPNPHHWYTLPLLDLPSKLSSVQNTQAEDDTDSKNSVSITNDALHNLLINYKDTETSKDHKKHASNIVSQKVGPLRKIRKILIIGVHGFFPTRMIRSIIGAPTGTSSKFANEAEKAVIRYLVENDMMDDDESRGVSIQKIALEKEGKIFDRVNFFLNILTKWEQELNEADFVFVAAHSQGCVVSIILLALLMKQGILKQASEKRIGILGMAGVNNGPFYGTDKSFFMKAYSTIEHDSMMELFELTKFDSVQSLAYKEAMQTIIGMNVKLCLVGSINDQLVPLYSALASHVFHPNIYRACYIDSSSKTPAFIKTLISFCCQLQNMGYFDNNVIKEISPILAGPLTGGGHSKIYNDGKVYDLGIKFMLDTDDLVIPRSARSTVGKLEDASEFPFTNKIYVKEYNVGKIGTNPFILPWCLRGLIFNVQKNWRSVNPQITVQHDTDYKSGTEEIINLYELFDQWRPETKALKDLKFRLNGIRASKL